MTSPKVSTFRSFHVRVALAIMASMLFVFLLGNFFIFKYSLDSQFEAVRTRLMVIARTASLMVDPKTFEAVPLTKEGINSPAYLDISQKLQKIKSVNPQVVYIYTMKKTDTQGIWQFVVDPEPVVTKPGKQSLTSYPGDQYKAARYPQMMKAFDGPAADDKITIDEWGALVSGYAPITNEAGEAIGMLGVDIKADDIYQIETEVYRRGFLVFMVGFLLSAIIGVLAAQRIANPVAKLTQGANQLSTGHLDYRVDVPGDDEISKLAETFNLMAMNLEGSRDRLMAYFYDVVKSLIKILELKDQYTRGHSDNVAEYAGKIAARMGYPEETIDLLKKITLLHDIGKLGINDAILNKNGVLTEEEWDMVRKHPTIGEDILKPVLRDEPMLAVIRQHHERYDGMGYPDGLMKEEINIFAAIVTVADAYDAMVSKRSYKEAMARQKAIEELKAKKGKQFNPKVVDIFINILNEEIVKKESA